MASTGRFKRNKSQTDYMRETLEDCVHELREFITRTKNRIHNKFYTSNEEDRFTSKRARVISVFLYAFSVSVCAMIIGWYYTYQYRPCTKRLFSNFAPNTHCLDNSNGDNTNCFC
ncbi:hypothetical protein ACF0H5_012856 [Mactra antiquata]